MIRPDMSIASKYMIKPKTSIAALITAMVCLAGIYLPAKASSAEEEEYSVIIRQAEEYEKAGETEKALDYYKLAMKAAPDKAEPWAKASMMYLILQKSDEAMAAADNAIRIDPGHRGAWLNKSVIELASGKHTEALYTTGKAIERFPDDTDLMNNMATALMGMGRLNSAEDTLLKAIKIKPDDSSLNYNLACVYARSGIRMTALVYLDKAIMLDPKLKESARTDPDLDRLRDMKPFKEIISD